VPADAPERCLSCHPPLHVGGKCGGRGVFMVLPLIMVPVAALPECGWCTGGACQPTCAVVKDHFNVSITAATQRTMPYWRAPSAKPLGVADPFVTTGVIIHHGSARNGDDYFCSMYNGLLKHFGSASIGTVLLVSPQIYELSDGPSSAELYWDPRSGGTPDRNWAWGGNSSAALDASLASFSVLDEMLATMMDKALYPRLSRLLVAGHSAGGQIVQRYALASALQPSVPLSYFPANPSSYTYVTSSRPALSSPWTCGGFCDNTTIKQRHWSFAPPSKAAAAECPKFDAYGYGLGGGHLPPYLAARGVDAMREAYGKRAVTYLSGESDVCDQPFQSQANCTPGCDPYDGGLDTSCEAYLQGDCRMMRAHAFAQHVQAAYAHEPLFAHKLMSVPGVGHSGCAMFQADATLDAMFSRVSEVAPTPT